MFIITDSSHRDCDDCRALYDQAVTHARISGSVGATFGVNGGSKDHWVRVTRARTAAAGIYELAHPTGHYNNDPL